MTENERGGASFKAFYEARYGVYPGTDNEAVGDVVKRVLDALAEYVDYIVASKLEKGQ